MSAKDLISQMLQIECKNRPTAEEALAHSWLMTEAPDTQLGSICKANEFFFFFFLFFTKNNQKTQKKKFRTNG